MRDPDDHIPFGHPVPDSWAGATWGPDRTTAGLYCDGPLPSQNPLARYIQGSVVPDITALPPELARLCLTRPARRLILKRTAAFRQAIPAPKGGRLKPLTVGRANVAR